MGFKVIFFVLGIVGLIKISECGTNEMDVFAKYGDKVFLISRKKVDAYRAAKECSQIGQGLVSLEDKMQNDLIKNRLKENFSDDVWVHGRIDDTHNVIFGPSGAIPDYQDFPEPVYPTLVEDETTKCFKEGCTGSHCAPNCGTTPNCNITLLPCSNSNPILNCPPVLTKCYAERGECSVTCPDCEIVPPVCQLTRGPCVVKNATCHAESAICQVHHSNCTTVRPDCITVDKPCRESTIETPCPENPKCRFLERDCITTTAPCFTTQAPCQTTHKPCSEKLDKSGKIVDFKCGEKMTICPPPTTICPSPQTTCRPPFECDPIICVNKTIVCEKPETHCPAPITTCTSSNLTCTDPAIECGPPVVECPDPVVTCTQPQFICPGPIVSCPGPISHCDAPLTSCPLPKPDCPAPIIDCEEPIPCEITTEHPLINPTCPPGFTECNNCTVTPIPTTTTPKPGHCIMLGKNVDYLWQARDCMKKRKFICEVDQHDYYLGMQAQDDSLP